MSSHNCTSAHCEMPGSLDLDSASTHRPSSRRDEENRVALTTDSNNVASDFDPERLANCVLNALGGDIGRKIALFIKAVRMSGYDFLSLNHTSITVLSEDDTEVAEALLRLRGEEYHAGPSEYRRPRRHSRVDAVFPTLSPDFQRIKELPQSAHESEFLSNDNVGDDPPDFLLSDDDSEEEENSQDPSQDEPEIAEGGNVAHSAMSSATTSNNDPSATPTSTHPPTSPHNNRTEDFTSEMEGKALEEQAQRQAHQTEPQIVQGESVAQLPERQSGEPSVSGRVPSPQLTVHDRTQEFASDNSRVEGSSESKPSHDTKVAGDSEELQVLNRLSSPSTSQDQVQESSSTPQDHHSSSVTGSGVGETSSHLATSSSPLPTRTIPAASASVSKSLIKDSRNSGSESDARDSNAVSSADSESEAEGVDPLPEGPEVLNSPDRSSDNSSNGDSSGFESPSLWLSSAPGALTSPTLLEPHLPEHFETNEGRSPGVGVGVGVGVGFVQISYISTATAAIDDFTFISAPGTDSDPEDLDDSDESQSEVGSDEGVEVQIEYTDRDDRSSLRFFPSDDSDLDDEDNGDDEISSESVHISSEVADPQTFTAAMSETLGSNRNKPWPGAHQIPDSRSSAPYRKPSATGSNVSTSLGEAEHDSDSDEEPDLDLESQNTHLPAMQTQTEASSPSLDLSNLSLLQRINLGSTHSGDATIDIFGNELQEILQNDLNRLGLSSSYHGRTEGPLAAEAATGSLHSHSPPPQNDLVPDMPSPSYELPDLSFPQTTLTEDLEDQITSIIHISDSNVNNPPPRSSGSTSHTPSQRPHGPQPPRRTIIPSHHRTLWIPHESRLGFEPSGNAKKPIYVTPNSETEQATKTYADKSIQTDKSSLTEITKLKRVIRRLEKKAVNPGNGVKREPRDVDVHTEKSGFFARLFAGTGTTRLNDEEDVPEAELIFHPVLLMK